MYASSLVVIRVVGISILAFVFLRLLSLNFCVEVFNRSLFIKKPLVVILVAVFNSLINIKLME